MPAQATTPDPPTLTVITGGALLSWSLMLSQAMESVTRAFYARSDLDLILSSPAAPSRAFAVRIATVALSVAAMAMLIAAPFINVLALRGGAQWLGAYGVFAAMGAAAAALAVALTVGLFQPIGPKRTRLIAQIVAAVIGAAFVIGLQVAAILSSGTLSRLVALQSEAVAALAPGLDSIALVAGARDARDTQARSPPCSAQASSCSGWPLRLFAPRFADHAIAAAGVAGTTVSRRAGRQRFRRDLAGTGAAAQGMDAAAARSMAGLADADAAALPAAAGPAAVAQLRRRQRRAHPAGAGAGHGGRTARRRPRLARHLGRGRARSGRDRAGCRPRQIVRAKIEAVIGVIAIVFVAVRRGARAGLAVARGWSPPPASLSPRPRRPRSSSGSARRPNAAISAAARPPRASRPLPKRSRRSPGRRPPAWRPPAPGSPSSARS